LRIAIFHDFMENAGGSEKMMLQAAKEFRATIITTNVNYEAVKAMQIKGVEIIDLGRTPKHFILKHLVICAKFFLCDFRKDFDFFIFSGNRSIFAAYRHRPNFWYCNSPERSVFDLYEFYKKILPPHNRILFAASAVLFRLAYLGFAVPNVQHIIANSENVKKRISTYLKRDSAIIHPPVETGNFRHGRNGGYWLSVNRLYPGKRLELQLEAFKMMPDEKLVIIGGHVEGDVSEQYMGKILGMLPENVSAAGVVDEDELVGLYAGCRGFVTTSMDEDFGLTAVEAMASGKAVVAVDEGGYRETIVHGKTGYLVRPDPHAIADAVRKISKKPGSYKGDCIERAREFDLKIFIDKMKNEIRGHSWLNAECLCRKMD